ncbi:MAG: dNTP triphosphohydrolase [Maribacter sp.]|nr:dNTP triphosphohydrolase [Maribacter sp.]
MSDNSDKTLHEILEKITGSAFRQTTDARPQLQKMFEAASNTPNLDPDLPNNIEELMASLANKFAESGQNGVQGEASVESEIPLYHPENDFRRELQKASHPKSNLNGIKDASRILHSASFRKMQGKMQLYPLNQSELFRNRLTHSIEVAEISVRIAEHLNKTVNYFLRCPINLNIVQAAGLAHDIGHPPFGHAGEKILNSLMADFGGFESNAQSLRVLSQLEPRATNYDKDYILFPHNPDKSVGLHLSYRTLASVVKYDREIKDSEIINGPTKGYYPSSKKLISNIKAKVIKNDSDKPLNTVECQIMDIADDIAYSTYDFEDSMISEMIHPMDLFTFPEGLRSDILNRMNKAVAKWNYNYDLTFDDVTFVFASIFDNYVTSLSRKYDFNNAMHRLVFFGQTYQESIRTAKEPKLRRAVTEALIDTAVKSVNVVIDKNNPELSRIRLGSRKLLEIEALKAFNYCVVTNSNKLKLLERRVKRVLTSVFKELVEDPSGCLFPAFVREQFRMMGLWRENEKPARARFVCDYIAGMSEREVINICDKINSSDVTNILGVE